MEHSGFVQFCNGQIKENLPSGEPQGEDRDVVALMRF